MFKNKEQDFLLEDVLNGCRKNNSNAQKRLFENFYGFAKNICLRYGSSVEEADEMLNDGFIKVFNNIEKYEDTHSFKAWLRTVFVRTCIDYIRKYKPKADFVDIDQQFNLALDINILEKLSAEEILAIIQKLPPVYRSVFSLYVIDGYNHNEIAEQLGISEGTSRSNLSKARTKLQEWIKIYLKEPETFKDYV